MGFKTLINKFTAGELDPKFLAEVDYEGYRKGARKLRNAFCLPQGAAQRRFGTRYERSILNMGANITNRNHARLLGFEYLTDEIYWLVLRAESTQVALDIFLDDVFQFTVFPLGEYTVDDIPNIRWEPDINKVYFFHEDYLPRIVQRMAANNWTDTAMVFTLYPAEDFSFIDSPTNNYSNNGTTFTPNAANATTLTASTAVFTSNHAGIAPNAGGLFQGNGGVFRIMTVNAGGTVATGYTTDEFTDTSAIKGAESFLGERAWNDGSVIAPAPAGTFRGFPRHGEFYQQRLTLGGSPASPGTAYASEVKDYYNFDNSNIDPSTGWGVEAGVTGTDTIQDLISAKSLVVLTSKGPAATSILLDLPTIPSNVFLNTQGTESAKNVDGAILNNQILYPDRAGNTIWSMTYDIPDSGYTVTNASILSSHLIRNPRWADVFDPVSVDGRYYLLVNDDGTMAMYNSILEENIRSWSLAETLGSFIDVACVANQAKVLVQRQVGTDTLIPATGALQAVYTVDDTFNVFRNITVAINEASGKAVMVTDEDYILIGNEIPFNRIDFSFSTLASEDLNLTFEFLTNTGTWEEFEASDSTMGFTIDAAIKWDMEDVSNWKSQILLKTTKVYGDYPVFYWMRIRRNNEDAVTNPIINTMFINVSNVIYMEIIDFDVYMDCQHDTVSDDTGFISNLDHLVGQNAFVFANGFPLGTFYIDSTATLQINTANADVSIGLDYKPIIVPMPVVALLQNGYSVYDPEKIQTIYIDYLDTLGLTVQMQNLPQVVPGEFLTDETPVPTSDFYKIPAYSGWDPRVDIEISQSYPAPMTIRGICYVVEVS